MYKIGCRNWKGTCFGAMDIKQYFVRKVDIRACIIYIVYDKFIFCKYLHYVGVTKKKSSEKRPNYKLSRKVWPLLVF